MKIEGRIKNVRGMVVVVLVFLSLTSPIGISSDHSSTVHKDQGVSLGSYSFTPFVSSSYPPTGSSEKLSLSQESNPEEGVDYQSTVQACVAHTYYADGTNVTFKLQTNGYQEACLIVDGNTEINVGTPTSQSSFTKYFNTTVHGNLTWHINQYVITVVGGRASEKLAESGSDEVYGEHEPGVEIESPSHYYLTDQPVHIHAVVSCPGITSIVMKIDGSEYSDNSTWINRSFSNPGKYNVSAWITNHVGMENETFFTLFIESLNVSVSSSLNPDYLNLDREVQFYSSVQNSGLFPNESYSFKYDLCGPNSRSLLLQGNYETFGYTFSQPGIYYVNMSVTDNQGLTSYGNLIERVYQGGPPISVSVNNPKAYPVNSSLELQASVSSSFNPTSYSFFWTIGGKPYSGQDIVLSLNAVGNFSIFLNVTDSLGGKGSYHSYVNVVYPGHYSGIEISQENYTSGLFQTYQIQVRSISGIQTVLYDISGETYEAPLDNISYHKGVAYGNYTIVLSLRQYIPGTYDIKIIAFNNLSGSNQASFSFNVNATVGQQSFSLISLFGGTFNFIIFILSVGGLLIAYLTYEKSENPTVVINDGNRKIDVKGKKVK